MKKPARIAFLYSLFALGFCFVWSTAHFFYFGYKWLMSYSLKPQSQSAYLDVRKDKASEGKMIRFRALKADPEKSVYFGHVWVVWEKPPPLANGAIASGYYPSDRKKALDALILSLISPFAWIEGQAPVKGVMKDDVSLKYDWELMVRTDEASYSRALRIDSHWRNQDKYSLRAGIGKKTNNCRDYVFQIAQTIGLNTDAYNWAEFPPETFVRFIKQNQEKYGGPRSLLTVAN